MTISRRAFLRSSGLLAAYTALPAWLSACAPNHAASAAAPAQTATLPPTLWEHSAPTADAPIAHLLSRLSFGPRPGEVARVAQLGADAYLEQQLNPAAIDDALTDRLLAGLPTLALTNAQLIDGYPRRTKAERQANPDALGPQQVERELRLAALARAFFSERQLLEVLVDLWSNHFNITVAKGNAHWFKTVDDREVIRAYALGTFRDLLLASAKSPAMLVSLDNAQNVADRPASAQNSKAPRGINENYAREVMELHTVGADAGYSQEDVRTVARLLTGWGVAGPMDANPGTFVFRPRQHDTAAKSVAFLKLEFPAGGGQAEGEQLLAALAAHPATAQRIARKLVVRFVADDPPPALVDRAAQTYLSSGTDIKATLRVILTSAEFQAAAGQQIKQPLRLLASAVRAVGGQPPASAQELLPLSNTLTNLGQQFFAWGPPNGYPQPGAAWLNSGGLIGRWNLAFALAEGRSKGVTADLGPLAQGAQTAGALVDQLCAALLHATPEPPLRAALVGYVAGGGHDQTALDAAALRTRLPELAGLVLASPAFQVY